MQPSVDLLVQAKAYQLIECILQKLSGYERNPQVDKAFKWI